MTEVTHHTRSPEGYSLFLSVKPHQEKLNASHCGPASLKMVLDYFGTELSEDRLAEMTGCTVEDGVEADDIKRVAEELGFECDIHDDSTFEDLEYWLKKKVPVIVDWITPGVPGDDRSIMAGGHYSVVVGLNDTHILLLDPQIGGYRSVKRKDFWEVWYDHIGNSPEKGKFFVRQLIAIF